MHIFGGFPEGFDWLAYDKVKLQNRRAIEIRRKMLQSYLPALARILAGGASPFPADQQLIIECVRLVHDEVAEDIKEVAELHHRHAQVKPPDPPVGEAPPDYPPANS